MAVYNTFYASPLGVLEIQGTEHVINSVAFTEHPEKLHAEVPDCLRTAVQQLDEYFQGQRQVFTLRVSQPGTEFQQKVWEALLSIPFGQTSSYLRLAQLLDNPDAVRAIGSANSKNQLAIIVPCHRIIGQDGRLTGYAGGLWRKQWLLNHEQKYTGNWQMSLF